MASLQQSVKVDHILHTLYTNKGILEIVVQKMRLFPLLIITNVRSSATYA